MLHVEEKLKGIKIKKRGSILTEWIVYGICFLVVASFLTIAGSAVINFIRTSTATSEMRQIADEVVSYSGLRRDGQLPASLDILLDDAAISASDSVSGQEYGKFLPKQGRWEGGKVLDPWNVEYEYTANSDGTGKIVSTGSGKNIERDF